MAKKESKDKANQSKDIHVSDSDIQCENKPIEKMTKEEVLEEAKNAQAELNRMNQINREIKKINNLRRHISKVQDAAQILAERLIENGYSYLARKIVANSMTHDISKFRGIEWEYLVKVDGQEESKGDNLKLAIHQHVTSNDHHPECWGSIDGMSQEAMADMVCDLHARASEAGTDLRSYVKEVFCKKHNITTKGKAYKRMKKFIDLLLDVPLKPINLDI